ncbi:MKRN2 opposite strand protein [Protopterus annectens]|uniref:MKRN2 opposite strand protein n=1 Tax=Protopterus annectens TaxID=7888 RepID=UPI001CF963BC|nr:MKRN2 opposite strand protein [Protopterus annectens]XP_043934005.1 MKRN2 opposite strand protein [Protopterus annectens]
MQSPAMEKSIIKFHHCKKEIYCFFVPEQCPICEENLSAMRLEEAPVSIPNPFVNGHREKCSFVLRPTKGSFLKDYDGQSDLHVGITNTSGVVYNYNENGILRDTQSWEHCVSVPLVQPDMYSLLDQWNKYLEQFSESETWLPYSYDEVDHNCYTYALTFINCVLATQGKHPLSKNEFTEKFVLPKTKRASRYIAIYKEISENYFHIVECYSAKGKQTRRTRREKRVAHCLKKNIKLPCIALVVHML